MPTESEAVRLLQELGLTEYEARCFVALSRVGKSTATEISDLSGVPRSRVYDAVGRLHDRGLVDIQQSEPREFQALDVDDAMERIGEQYESVVEDAGTALQQLERVESAESSGAWAISDADHVADRMATLVHRGEEHVYVLVADEAFRGGDVTELLSDAAERGLSVTVEVSNEDVAERFEADVPDADVHVSDLATDSTKTEENWLGGILVVDDDSVLISALQESLRPGTLDESAIWASGANHGLVVGLRQVVDYRIEQLDSSGDGA